MIIVFGSNVLDLFYDLADVPEPDQVIFLDSHVEAPGGKGANQAVAAARAGAEVRFFGALGDGGHGRQMYKNLMTNHVDVSGIKTLKGIPSGLANIYVNKKDGTHRIVVSHGANKHARQDTIPDKHLTKDTTVVLQGELPITETEALIARAAKKGSRTILNLAPVVPLSEQALKDLDIIVLNEHEARALGKQLGMPTDDKMVFAASLYARFNLTTIVTLGPNGSVCAGKDGLLTVSPLKIKAVDTVGAGDAFVGYLSAGLDSGKSLSELLRQAAVAGSLACTKIGAQTALPQADEVVARLSEISVQGQSTMGAKVSASLKL